MISSVSWLHDTFHSKEATQRLLSPELEAGTISYHDFQAACDFYPSSGIRRYQFAAPVLGSTAASAYTFYRWSRRPPLPGRFWLSQSFGVVAGCAAGVWLTVRAHSNFMRSLDDQKAFFRALENVYKRLENPHAHAHAPVSENPDASDPAWPDSPPSTASAPSPRPQSAPRPSSKWDEIRIANNPQNGGVRTAWDRLRHPQTPARRTQDAPSDPSDAREPNPSDADDSRAAEQAKFDAMLDAERRKAETAQASGPSWGSR
ncbi:hypothetical protein OF83DRAFT_1100007 [Amylostereum chailletii]|nr:hypothetical protein OF83DRAFT_1100007 [Amylostereum chailletii]